MKKVKIITIIAIIYIGLIFINTQVFATSKGKTINDTTRLREKASTSSSTVTLISINEEVEIISEDGEWYKVKYTSNGKTYSGYIRNDMLKTDSKETTKQDENKTEKEENIDKSTQSEEPVDNTQEIEIKEENTGVLKSKIEIRILPLINSSITGNISKKTEITILETLGSWTYIESDEQAGWVITNTLQEKIKTETNKQENEVVETENKEETTKKEETKVTETAKKEETTETKQKMYVSSQTVNLRKESNSTSAILKQLSRNTQVTVIEKVNNTWSKVEVDGITGYISSTYLSKKKTEVTSRGADTSREEKVEEEKKEEKKKEEVKKEETKKEDTKKQENKNTETNKKEQSKTEETPKKETDTKTSSKVSGSDIVKSAKKYLGYKYVLGAASPKAGFDCSGLVYYVYGQKGYSLNRTSSAQASNGKKVSKSNLKAGDLVFFSQGSKKIGHVGIYIGGNEFIHAANPKKGVIITSLSNSYYAKRYVTARRIIN